jgi:homoserine kinase
MSAGLPSAPFEIIVPGSTSNLGPGFDALGLALQLTLRLRIVDLEDDARGTIDWRLGSLPLDGENLIDTAFRWVSPAEASAPEAPRALPSMVVEVASDIPLRGGLGSSAAAIVAGRRLRGAVLGLSSRAALLDDACALEGHPDNTSASILGGLVTSGPRRHGGVAAIAVPWPRDVRIVVATPQLGLATKTARAVLPAQVPYADAVHNVQHTALLLQALATGDHATVRDALSDRLHQPYRAPLVPGLARALAFEAPSVLGMFLSGAGPSIAALVVDDGREAMTFLESMYRDLCISCDVRCVPAHPLIP